jgi:biopolymer transport protein ExbD
MTIDSNGSIQLDGKVVAVEDLPAYLEKKINQEKNTVISIHADKAIEFELFGKVIGIAKQAGAEDFMLATGNEKPVNEF